jgi:sugar phosphate isomerase/epimerase
MRLGTTSYIYPADIITNARKLAGRVDDIELVIFQADREDDLPGQDTIAELIQIASDYNMSYTVHLPLDLGLADQAPLVDKAIRVIHKTQVLSPHGFIVHLDGRIPGDRIDARRWLENSISSLEILSGEVEPEKLCVENLENQHPDMIDSILEKTSVSCCVDVGHLWMQGLDPMPALERWMPRARVVHIHGVGKRDHKSLSLMPDDKLDPVVEFLHSGFGGVVTFEIFNERDLLDSLETLQRSLARIIAP